MTDEQFIAAEAVRICMGWGHFTGIKGQGWSEWHEELLKEKIQIVTKALEMAKHIVDRSDAG